uniref:Uncharacterized protein n=1 Tax=Timema genevievae TaxID=629358 RepID=A0A7R9JTW0_TIMGE|nr:unnamed protein product [Timema genevievae]
MATSSPRLVNLAQLDKQSLKEFVDSFDTVITDCDGPIVCEKRFMDFFHFLIRNTVTRGPRGRGYVIYKLFVRMNTHRDWVVRLREGRTCFTLRCDCHRQESKLLTIDRHLSGKPNLVPHPLLNSGRTYRWFSVVDPNGANEATACRKV